MKVKKSLPCFNKARLKAQKFWARAAWANFSLPNKSLSLRSENLGFCQPLSQRWARFRPWLWFKGRDPKIGLALALARQNFGRARAYFLIGLGSTVNKTWQKLGVGLKRLNKEGSSMLATISWLKIVKAHFNMLELILGSIDLGSFQL